jgi:acyl carrier protein
MQRSAIISQLTRHIADNVLYGRDIGLDETTPLLEWGIINSLEIVRLLSFVHKQFNVEIPIDNVVPENFINLAAIADLLLKLSVAEQKTL